MVPIRASIVCLATILPLRSSTVDTHMVRFALCLAALIALNLAASVASNPTLDRSRLPAALQNASLRHLSSGGLILLDRNGDIVRPPQTIQAEQAGSVKSTAAATVALDPRVGANIRLGDDPAQLGSQNAQAEPFITRSRTNFDFVVAVFQEGRYVDGGAIDLGYSVSSDGGLTWTRALVPGLTQAVGGPYYRATDPAVGIDLNNNIYICTDAATDSSFNNGEIAVQRSSDGGATFTSPSVVYSPPEGTGYFPDKDWMVVNTFANTPTVNRVFVTFTLFTTGNNSPIVGYYSDDGAQTWKASNGSSYITTSNSSVQGSQPVFLPTGNLAVVYWRFLTNSTGRIEVAVSTNGGNTFGSAIPVANVTMWQEPSIRDGSFLPSATVDRTTNSIYVVYQATFNGSPRVMFTKSVDGGKTWSAPMPISDNPAGLGVFNPAIAASPDGNTLTAAFYDHRNNPTSTTLVDMYEAQSFDGGATWQPNIRLTSTSTDATRAPLAQENGQVEGYMLGDYLGVADPVNRNIPAIPLWVDTRTGNPDPFVTRIGVAPQFDFTSWQAARLSYAQIQAPQYGLKQLNISTRGRASTGENALIGGFIVSGSESKRVLIRGLGPSLAQSVVSGYLFDPMLELRDSSGNLLASNDNWQDSQASDIQQTGIPPSDPTESAIIATVPPGNYTALLMPKSINGSGVGLVELYDLSSTGKSQLANISTRGLVEESVETLIGGFIIGGGVGPGGTGSARVVVRALGPSLSSKGVANALEDPTLALHDGNGTTIFQNDNWKDTQQSDIEATGLAPTDERESAIVVLVPPGNYTAVVESKSSTISGIGLVESYNVP